MMVDVKVSNVKMIPRSRNERNVSEYEYAKGTASEYEKHVCPLVQMQKYSLNMKIQFHKSDSPGGRHPVDQEPGFPQVALNHLLLLTTFQSEVFFLHILFFMLIPAVNCEILPMA